MPGANTGAADSGGGISGKPARSPDGSLQCAGAQSGRAVHSDRRIRRGFPRAERSGTDTCRRNAVVSVSHGAGLRALERFAMAHRRGGFRPGRAHRHLEPGRIGGGASGVRTAGDAGYSAAGGAGRSGSGAGARCARQMTSGQELKFAWLRPRSQQFGTFTAKPPNDVSL